MLLLNKTSEIQKFLIVHGGMRWATGLLFLAGIFITSILDRSSWPLILLPFAVAVAIYLLVVLKPLPNAHDIKYWLVLSIVARAVLVFIFPNLSDDLYRFIWDGHCTLQGLNPYQIVPSEFVALHGEQGHLTSALLDKLNSPDYHTVYPPLSQYIFAASAWFGGSNWLVSSICLKLVILAAECSTIWMMFSLLSRHNRGSLVLLYALNPLVIIELVGNIHFEGVMIWGIIAAYYALMQMPKRSTRNLVKASVSLTAAIYVKLIPIIIFPLLLRRLGWRHFFILSAFTAGLLVLLSLPYYSPSATIGPADSIDLYFHTFEFNASMYYVFRWLGYLWKDYNMIATIGTLLSLLTFVLLSGLFLLEKRPTIKNWPYAGILALTMFLMFASVVHPWYICGLVALAPFTRLRYPVLWSILAFLSYSAYRTDPVEENLWLVGFEYIAVFGFLIWEFIKKPQLAE